MLLKLPERVLAPHSNVDHSTHRFASASSSSGTSYPGTMNTVEYPCPMNEPNGFDPHAVWRQLQSELAIEQGGSFDRWVHDTWVIAFEDGEFIIGLPDAFRYDWIVHRLSRQIKRKLAVIVGRSTIDVKFRVQPRPLADAPARDATPLYAQSLEADEARAQETINEHTLADDGQRQPASGRADKQNNRRPATSFPRRRLG